MGWDGCGNQERSRQRKGRGSKEKERRPDRQLGDASLSVATEIDRGQRKKKVFFALPQGLLGPFDFLLSYVPVFSLILLPSPPSAISLPFFPPLCPPVSRLALVAQPSQCPGQHPPSSS